MAMARVSVTRALFRYAALAKPARRSSRWLSESTGKPPVQESPATAQKRPDTPSAAATAEQAAEQAHRHDFERRSKPPAVTNVAPAAQTAAAPPASTGQAAPPPSAELAGSLELLVPRSEDRAWRWNAVALVVGAALAGAVSWQVGYRAGADDTKAALRPRLQLYREALRGAHLALTSKESEQKSGLRD